MGSCTSTEERRQKQKQNQQLHKRTDLQKSIVLDNKQLSTIPLTIIRSQRPHSLSTNLNLQSSYIEETRFDQPTTNSLIQLYSLKTENNNHSMASSHIPPRVPVPKSRLSTQQIQSTGIRSIRPKHPSSMSTIGLTSPTGTRSQTMSANNRPTLSNASSNPSQTRFGFIPRPTTPGIQQAQGTSLIERSRSISPSSTNNVNTSSSTTVSQRLIKPQSANRPVFNRSVTTNTTTASKTKLPPSSSHKESSKSTVTQRLRSNISVENSTTPTKTDVNTIRDRYKTQNRPNFLNRRSPLTSALKTPPIETPVIEEEKSEPTTNSASVEDNQNTELKSESSLPVSTSQVDSAYASTISPSNQSPSAQYSQTQRIRHRHSSTLSSASLISDVLNRDLSLDDDNCSLKSEDLLCDYDETLTIDSTSKNDGDSYSSNSVSIDNNKKLTNRTKTNKSSYQTLSKDHHSSTTSNSSNIKLQQSLDELGRLNNRIDNVIDSEHHRRLLTRSVSLKPPMTSLPPREDAEQILMDIETYRQIMKDVMVVKTILHQLDRLLKHSDGANMTDSMIGSFHESMISSRHFSTSIIDENSSNDDLLKEIFTLRKEREQDKQTIKLLQEQMYKYSSQTND